MKFFINTKKIKLNELFGDPILIQNFIYKIVFVQKPIQTKYIWLT